MGKPSKSELIVGGKYLLSEDVVVGGCSFPRGTKLECCEHLYSTYDDLYIYFFRLENGEMLKCSIRDPISLNGFVRV